MKFISLSVAITIIFAPLASAMAFIVTYDEYLHHYPDNKQPARLALEAALVTFVFFVVLSFVIGLFLENIVGSQSL